jgi:flagellar motor protein MotB
VRILLFIFIFSLFPGRAQDPGILKKGDHAPAFIMNVQQASIQSFPMPYLNRYVLLHFWSSTVHKSQGFNKYLNRLAGRYKNAMYRNAEGFEVIAIAVQSDKTAWAAAIKADTLENFINGIAVRGYNDEICKKFGVTQVPTDILIDQNGVVLATNLRIRDLENILDDQKNYQPVKKDVIGTLALSANPSDLLKYGKLFLFDNYGDSISQTTTNMNGGFVFSEIKLNQDFILKVDNQSDIITSDPLALYSYKGEKIMDGKTFEKGFVFYIPSKMSLALTEGGETTTTGGLGPVNVTKDLVFKNNGTALTPHDEQELNAIFSILQKNKTLSVEVATHTDSKLDDKASIDLATKESNTVKNFFVGKGISPARIKMAPKGKSLPRKKCTNCTEEDHKQNRRTEFVVYKS